MRLGTQNFRDINSSIVGLLTILIKVKKADILGKADHYIRKARGGYRGGMVSTRSANTSRVLQVLQKSHPGQQRR